MFGVSHKLGGNMLRKFAVTSAIAAALVLSVPFAANAAGSYVEQEKISVSGNAAAGGVVNVSFGDASFGDGANVSIIVTGNTSVTFGAVTSTTTRTADADGAVSFSVILPADASGSYEVTATDGTRTGTAAFAIAPAAGGGTGTGSTGGSATGTGSTSGNGLASTGQDLPLTAMFVGGGALVLGGVVLGTVYTTRRRGVARQN